MLEKGVITSFFVLLMSGTIKATSFGMKLFIMACAGLAGMYMVHLLAQDYNEYQSLNRQGRSVTDMLKKALPSDSPAAWLLGLNQANSSNPKTFLDGIKAAEEFYKRNHLFNLNRILQFDPTGCARRYVCTVATKSLKKLSQPEKNIIRMLRNLPKKTETDPGPAAFKAALEFGRRKKDADSCAEQYPKCIFSVEQMLKIVGFFKS